MSRTFYMPELNDLLISVPLCSRLKRFIIIISDSIRGKNINTVNIEMWTSSDEFSLDLFPYCVH
jgi:hypothetical protein